MKKVHQPHDTFFKSVFTVKENAIDFLKESLPVPLKANINLSQIKIDTNSYVGSKLKKYFSDIVYSGYYKENAVKLSFLFEHKSYKIPYPHFQLNQYILNTWEEAVKQDQEIPVVIPIVVYHGKEKWKIKPLTSYFKQIDDNLLPFIPNFTYLLSDLSAYSNEEIKNSLFSQLILKAAFLILKNSHDPDTLVRTLEKFKKIGYIYNKEEKGTLFIQNVLSYAFSLWEKKKDQPFRNKIEEIFSEQGVDVVTILEDILLKSEKKGRIEDKQEIIIRQMNIKYKLTRTEIMLIKSIKDIEKLDNALDEFVFATSKDSILSKLK